MRKSLPIHGGQPRKPSETPQSLPGFDSVMSSLGPHSRCTRCHHIIQSLDGPHHCRPTHLPTFYTGAFAARQGSLSSASSSAIGSEPGTPTITMSRSPSISLIADSGDSASSTDMLNHRRRGAARKAPYPARETAKKAKKNGNERKSRSDQAEVLQNSEDMFEQYVGWKPEQKRSVQSQGNHFSAGVNTTKIDISHIALFLQHKYLHQEYTSALAAGREREWQAAMRGEINTYLARWSQTDQWPQGPPYDPSFDGSWLETRDKRSCRNEEKVGKDGKKLHLCATHPERGLNFVKCRKAWRAEAFARKREEFLRRSMGRL